MSLTAQEIRNLKALAQAHAQQDAAAEYQLRQQRIDALNAGWAGHVNALAGLSGLYGGMGAGIGQGAARYGANYTGNSMATQMAMSTCGPMTNWHTQESINDYATGTAGAQRADAGNQAGTRSEKPPHVVQKTFLVEERKEAARPKLTWETSPLWGRPAFGRFYNWSTHSPLRPFTRWVNRLLVRWAWKQGRERA